MKPTTPLPRTWAAKDPLLAPRLRADPGNLVWLQTQKPLFVAGQFSANQTLSPAGTAIDTTLDTEFLDDWSGHSIGTAPWTAPLPGWYLAQGDVGATNLLNTDSLLAGIKRTVSGSPTSEDGGKYTGTSTAAGAVRPPCCDLVSLAAGDSVNLYQMCNGAPPAGIASAHLSVEWVATRTGTVIASPPVPATWPPGAGTTLTNVGGISAGATSLTVASTTGMVIGGTLGLDYLNGSPTSSGAETVTISNIVGTTITISATTFGHAQNAPVAVPVSAAFLNQQVRDQVRFLSYPPIAKLTNSGTAATLATQVFPAATAVSFAAGGATVDNFGGYSGANPTRYTFPLAGVYFVYGQVYLQSTANYSLSAGLAINGGTILWGTTNRNSSATGRTMSATVRRVLRVTAGQFVELFGSQNAAGGILYANGLPGFSKMIVVFRGL